VIQAVLLVHWLVAGLFLVLRSSHLLVCKMGGAILFLSLRLCSWWSALIQSISCSAFGLFLIHLATISWMLGGSASPMVVSVFVFLLDSVWFVRKLSLMLPLGILDCLYWSDNPITELPSPSVFLLMESMMMLGSI
jgi:hypothetical protein